MAEQDVRVHYRAEVDELARQINLIVEGQEAVIKGEQQVEQSAKKATTAEEFATKKRLELLKSEQQALAVLERQQKLAFDPKSISAFNAKIAESRNRISLLSRGVDRELGGIGGKILNMGTLIAQSIGIAFSVTQIIRFGEAAVNAFVEAEKNAQQLKFAVVDVGKETEESFNRLIRQSEQLQKVSIFSDDAIQQAQKALTTFGLTSDQIDVIIPKILDFATITGKDLPSAIQAFGSGLQGIGREFKKFEIDVNTSKSTLENFTILSEGFDKFAGASGKALDTTSGKIAKFRNELDDFMEGVGGFLVGAASDFVQGIRNMGSEIQTFLSSLGFEKVESNLEKSADAFDRFRGEVSESLLSATTLADFDKRAEEFLNAATQGVDKRLQIIQGLERNLDQAKSRAVVNQKEIFAIQTAIDKERDTNLKNEQVRLALVNEVVEKLRLKFTETTKEIDKTREATDNLINTLDQISPEQAEKLLSSLQKIDLVRATGSIADFRDAVKAASEEVNKTVQTDFENTLNELNKIRDVAADTATDISFSLLDSILGRYGDIINATEDLAHELSNLFTTLSENQIQNIEQSKQAHLDSITAEEEALQASRDKRIISESDYETRSAALKQKRVDAEKKIADQINKIKRRQALIDKALASFEIIINTAQAISEVLTNPVLVALVAALGAAQLTTVAATPVPQFKRGTKGKKGSGMALVGEEGPEQVFLPDQAKVMPTKQTKTYGQVFDAMYDNRLDKYILQHYVTPALVKQKQEFYNQQQIDFAQHVTNNLQYEGLNADDLYNENKRLAKLIGQEVSKVIPRYQNPAFDPWRM